MLRIRLHSRGICSATVLLISIVSAVWPVKATAQVGAAEYDTTLITLQHTVSTVGDSLKLKLGTISVAESLAGRLDDAPGDSVRIIIPSGFRLVADSVVSIATSSNRLSGIRLDTSGACLFNNGLQPGSTESLLRIRPGGISSAGLYLAFMVKISSTLADTLVVDGLYIQSVDTTDVMYDSTTGGRIELTQPGVPANSTLLSRLVALPGAAVKLAFGVPDRIPDAGQTAGNIINSSPGGSLAADTGRGIVVTFLDAMNNLTTFGTTRPGVRALLTHTTAPGSGSLDGTSVSHWYDPHHVSISFDSLSYKKAEKIDLEFTLGTYVLNTVTAAVTSGITVSPGQAANISASITSKDEYAVDDTKKYNLMVTDRFFNPVSPTWIQAKELTPHGGVFTGTGLHGDSICTGTGSSIGETAFTFDPGNYFVGRDTLVFVARSSSPAALHYRSVLITPGELGGIIADYSGTPNGPAVTEKIAAGESVYVRAFLRDSYGNPIDADSKSGINFAIGSVLGKGMSLSQTGMVLTNTIEEPQYLNTVKTAIGMAIPYRVSTNVRAAADTVVASCENYSAPVLIPIRSNVPTSLRLVQTAGFDSSVVASDHANSIVFSDTVRDAYGNLADDPGLSVSLGPGRASYAVCFSTGGLIGFADAPGAPKVAVIDTVYPAAGVVTRSVYSGNKSGIDTLATWLKTNKTVRATSPVWVTPAMFSAISLDIEGDGVLTAGETRTILVEKADTYGNHIDWGLRGGESRLTSGAITRPSAGQSSADSAGLFAGTVNTGRGHEGEVDQVFTIHGIPGIASIGGTLSASFPYTSSTAGSDTQLVYARLSSNGRNACDTLEVVSTQAGDARRLEVLIDTTKASSHFSGDSVRITVTAVDSSGRRVYTYGWGEHSIVLNGSLFDPIIEKDTTHRFSYTDTRARHVISKGLAIKDTVFDRGKAVFYIHKFAVDSLPNTVSIIGNGFCDTSESSLLFQPLPADSSYGRWLVDIADTSNVRGGVVLTITPRDRYYNVNPTQEIIINLVAKGSDGIDFGLNPKVVRGVTEFHAPSTPAVPGMTVYVFNNDYSQIYGLAVLTGVDAVGRVQDLPTKFAVSQNYPNPFNPSTEISFDLPKSSVVTVVIFDILGREVRRLVDRSMPAGRYRVSWNGMDNGGSRVASGIYIYAIQAGDFSEARKMMLIR